jgi:hypothetical protein
VIQSTSQEQWPPLRSHDHSIQALERGRPRPSYFQLVPDGLRSPASAPTSSLQVGPESRFTLLWTVSGASTLVPYRHRYGTNRRSPLLGSLREEDYHRSLPTGLAAGGPEPFEPTDPRIHLPDVLLP